MVEAKYVCPRCGEIRGLVLVAKVWVQLDQDPANGQLETYTGRKRVPDHDHEWDGGSPMRCMECGTAGLVKDFDVAYSGDGPERSFDVEVRRAGFSTRCIRVTAANARRAEALALTEAEAMVFGEEDADFRVVAVTEVAQ